MGWIIRLLVNAVAIFIAAHIIKGIAVHGLWPALVAAIVLGLVNTFVRPILVLLTLPINLMSFGLFTLIINAILFYVVGLVVTGFQVSGFIPALVGSIVVSIISMVLSRIVK